MGTQGKARLAWQKGPSVLYAEATVDVVYEEDTFYASTDIERVPEDHRLGVLFGCELARDAVRSTLGGRKLSIAVREFRSQPCDTTLFAAAFVTFQAIADAIEVDMDGLFLFDESLGQFQFSYQSISGNQ